MKKQEEKYHILSREVSTADLNAVRFSTHIYNTPAELELAIQVMGILLSTV